MDYEKFAALDPDQQAEVFLSSTIKEKSELLLRSQEPEALVKALSQEELFLVTKEMDVEERGEVIRFASLPQLFFISDLECWSQDRINIKGFIQWLETLRRADDIKLLSWLVNSDYESVVSGFKHLIQVVKTEREYAMDESLGDLPFFSLDENYFIYAREQDLETVRRSLEILFENNRGKYIAVLEGILSEMDDEIEEEAYQMRQRRLAERGFPEPESAHRIYKAISRKEFDEFPIKEFQGRDQESPSPNYLSLWNEKKLFIDDVLLAAFHKNPVLHEQLKEEMAWLANKVIACDGVDLSSEEKVKAGVERVRAYLSLGLELLCGTSLEAAYEIVKNRWLEIVFRWGITRALELAQGAHELLADHWKNHKDAVFRFLNPPYEFTLRGLIQPVPVYYDPNHSTELNRFRDFTTVDEISRAKISVMQLKLVHRILEKKSLDFFENVQRWIKVDDKEITLYQTLAQYFVLFVIDPSSGYRELSVKEAQTFMKKALLPKGKSRVFDEKIKEAFLKSIMTESETAELRPLWSLALDNLLEEIKDLDPAAVFKAEFVSMLAIKTP